MATVCIKVDVDTFKGMREGVPNLARIFRENGVRATFFIAMGPDNSGKAVRRIFTKKGFLGKMLRTRAVSVYGFPTVLYGTLLPSPQIARGNGDVFDLLKKEGHEIGVHGYDHVKWHDYAPAMTEQEVEGELDKAVEMYALMIGARPRAFAAPGWSWCAAAQKMMDKKEIEYTSNTRGSAPFFPVYGAERSNVLEIPTTLPTLDEVLGCKEEKELSGLYLPLIKRGNESVFTIHAELEGMAYSGWFSEFIRCAKKEGVNFLTLSQFSALKLKDRNKIPFCEIVSGEIEGRAGNVAMQKNF